MELATLSLGERRTDNGQPFSYSTRILALATVRVFRVDRDSDQKHVMTESKKTVLPVREKWDRHKEPVSPYFRFSSSRERSERLDSALSRRYYR